MGAPGKKGKGEYRKPRLIGLQKDGRPLYKSEKYDIMIASAYYLLADARCYDIDCQICNVILDVIRMLIKNRDELVGSSADKDHFIEPI